MRAEEVGVFTGETTASAPPPYKQTTRKTQTQVVTLNNVKIFKGCREFMFINISRMKTRYYKMFYEEKKGEKKPKKRRLRIS